MPPLQPSSSPNPRLQTTLARGMLLRVEPPAGEETGDPAGSDFAGLVSRAITFQYNPETVTRARAGRWEARSRKNRGVPSLQDDRARSGAGSAHLLAESETISLKISFDATEARMAGSGGDGVLPELAFLENTSMGRTKGRGLLEGESTRSVRPDDLLLVLGPKRTFPVVLTNLTITEQKFAPDLTPIRAEVDLRFNVLEPVDVSLNRWVAEAFNLVVQKRTTLSQQVEQATSVAEALNGALGRDSLPVEPSAGAARPANPSGG